MFNLNRTFWGMLVLLAVAIPAFGGLGGPNSILDMQRQADLIVAGAVASPFSAASTAAFSITIDRVLKGDPALSGATVQVSWSGNAPYGTGPGPTVAGNGLWFLQRLSNGWKLLPAFTGVPFELSFFHIPAGPVLAAYAYSPSASLSDKIASEIASAIEGAAGAFNFQFYALQNSLLDQLRSPVIAVLYQRLSNSAVPQQRILGISGLVRAGNSAALASATQMVSTLSNDPREDGILIESVRENFRSTDPVSIAVLGKAATDSTDTNLPFREAAAHALAAIHSKTALPYLAALLGDPDSHLQIEGVRGLGSFANGLAVQTADGAASLAYLQLSSTTPFRTPATLKNFALGPDAIAANKNSYVQFWTQWWSANRSTLGF